MSHGCPRCPFTSQFESALMMHQQLHHGAEPLPFPTKLVTDSSKSVTKTRAAEVRSMSYKQKDIQLLQRQSSTTRLLGKLRARICRSRHLFSHAEEPMNQQDLTAVSECTSKALKMEAISRCSSPVNDIKDIYACHLCHFDADRITALDRHLLNDHKIGLDNLLKLVLAKTKDGLNDDLSNNLYGIRQPYYRPTDDVIKEGEFIVETASPKIRILKHASTNTDLTWIPNVNENCQMISKELESLMKDPKCEKDELFNKMQTLNACMCKLVNSSNMMKKVLNESEGKHSINHRSSYLRSNSPKFDLGLGDQETPRDWERAHSENIERNRTKNSDKCKSQTTKLSAESYYF